MPEFVMKVKQGDSKGLSVFEAANLEEARKIAGGLVQESGGLPSGAELIVEPVTYFEIPKTPLPIAIK